MKYSSINYITIYNKPNTYKLIIVVDITIYCIIYHVNKQCQKIYDDFMQKITVSGKCLQTRVTKINF